MQSKCKYKANDIKSHAFGSRGKIRNRNQKETSITVNKEESMPWQHEPPYTPKVKKHGLRKC